MELLSSQKKWLLMRLIKHLVVKMNDKKQLVIFLNSIFFVLGFGIVFSLLGILLQSVLSNVAYDVQKWLGYFGGVIIIFLGLYMIGFVKLAFLEKEHKIKVKKKFRYSYLTSFVFGLAFAVGWTPCVGPTLGAIFTLAAVNPTSAFPLLFSYTLGLGLPFLVVGLFTDRASSLIRKAGAWMKYAQFFFGFVLIILGILIFTNNLSRVANIPFFSELLLKIETSSSAGLSISGLSLISIAISFVAGIISFLSPCVLPLIPAFLSYLASTVITSKKNDFLKK